MTLRPMTSTSKQSSQQNAAHGGQRQTPKASSSSGELRRHPSLIGAIDLHAVADLPFVVRLDQDTHDESRCRATGLEKIPTTSVRLLTSRPALARPGKGPVSYTHLTLPTNRE